MALHTGGKTPTSCLVVYSVHTVAYKAPRAVLSGGRRRRVRSPTLRVQAPLYRQGPGYSLVSGCSDAGSHMAAVLAWAPPSSPLLLGRRLLYKAPFPLGLAYSEHMLPVCLGSFCGGGACLLWLVEVERGWCHTGLRPLSILSGPCCL
jgi:hypothetical protein